MGQQEETKVCINVGSSLEDWWKTFSLMLTKVTNEIQALPVILA